jgi:predicted nucleic acid-binding protein
LVLIDTSAWIDYFHDRQLRSPVGQEVATLLTEGRAVTTGMVLAEVLQGAVDDAELSKLESFVGAQDFVEAGREVWRTAAVWSYNLRRRGLPTPLSDLVIAAAAVAGGHSVFATDPHFQRVPGLDLHQLRS